jgi:predicted MFS family arabinose efflux permease
LYTLLQGYISCAWGVEYIGYVMICYGICAGTSSAAFGNIIKYTGRVPVFILAVGVNVGAMVLMLKWEPNGNQPILFFVIAGLWGATEGVYAPQIIGSYRHCNIDWDLYSAPYLYVSLSLTFRNSDPF